jgi:hypothetical protein
MRAVFPRHPFGLFARSVRRDVGSIRQFPMTGSAGTGTADQRSTGAARPDPHPQGEPVVSNRTAKHLWSFLPFCLAASMWLAPPVVLAEETEETEQSAADEDPDKWVREQEEAEAQAQSDAEDEALNRAAISRATGGDVSEAELAGGHPVDGAGEEEEVAEPEE